MKRYLKPVLLNCLALLCCQSVHAQSTIPSNDSATSAVVLSGSQLSPPAVDLSRASAALTDPLISGASAGKTVWYKIPRNQDEPATYWVVEVTSLTGTGKMALFLQRDPENPLTSLTDTNPATTPVSFAPGETVSMLFEATSQDKNGRMIMLSGTGSVSLRFRQSALKNDFPITATVLPEGVRGSTFGNNSLATTSPDEPPGARSRLWYKWTPTFSGPAAVDTNFSFLRGFDLESWSNSEVHATALEVYQGTTLGALTLLDSDTDSGWGVNSRVKFTAVAGTTYYISVGTAPGQFPAFSFNPGSFNLNYYSASTAGEIYFIGGDSLGSASEDQGSRNFMVVRRYAGDFAVNCTLASLPASSTATAGTDYQAINTTVSFANPTTLAGSAWVYNGSINLLKDSLTEPTQSLTLGLSNVPLNAMIITPTTTLDILDNDSLSEDYLRVVSPEIRVSESATSIGLGLMYRVTDTTAVSVWTYDDTSAAQPDSDYSTFSSHTLDPTYNFTSHTLYISNDQVFEDEEEVIFNFQMGNTTPSIKVIIEDDDPFIPLAGRFSAALSYSGGTRYAQCFADVTTSGVVTGRLALNNRSIPFRTTLNHRGQAQVLLPVAGRPSLHLSIKALDATGGYRLTLLDSLTSRTSINEVVLQNYNTTTNRCPEAGRYTLASNFSEYGTATLEVSTTGAARVAARLFDGTAATLSGFIDGDGMLSVALPLYSGRGSLMFRGYLPLQSLEVGNLFMAVVRPARLGDPTALGYVQNSQSIDAVRYVPATRAQTSLQSWAAGTGKATLKDGPLMSTITKSLTVATGITAPADSVKLRISLLPGTGVFTGSFVLPGSTKTLPFTGVLSQLPGSSGYGVGHFFDGLKTGTIVIGAP
jgi:Calx-beta domain